MEVSMKRFLALSLMVFIFVLSVILLFGCATLQTGTDDLDIAIRDASDYLNDNIPAGSKIVILNIQSDYNNLSEYIIDELIANAVNDRIFTVVDRAQLESIRTELNFQLSGEVSDDSALTIGRFLGAQTIVSGAISEMGDRHRLRIRALNVETAQVQGQYNRNINTSRTITALMRGGRSTSPSYGTRGAGDSSGTSQTASAQTAAPAQSRGAANGTYTIWPRARATQGGLPTNFYIAQIDVSNDFIVFHFARSATGDFSNGHNGFWYAEQFTLQDLDNPSRFYKPVLERRTSNGMGTIWLVSFNRFPATRFKFSTESGGWPYSDNIPLIWDEIILKDPD